MFLGRVVEPVAQIARWKEAQARNCRRRHVRAHYVAPALK